MQALFESFFEDTRVQIIMLVIALDFTLGVIAALVDKSQQFRLSYVADFLRTDVLGKVLPFFVVYAGYKVAAGADLVIPGFDLELVMNGAWAIVLAALVGSVLKSLSDLGLLRGVLPRALAGSDPTTPSP